MIDGVCFRVRSWDNANNASGWSPGRCTQVPVDDRQMMPAGGWTRPSVSGALGGSMSTTTAHNATLKLTNVRARQVGILFRTCPGCGAVGVWFGSTYLGWVDLDKPVGLYWVPAQAFGSIRTGTASDCMISIGRSGAMITELKSVPGAAIGILPLKGRLSVSSPVGSWRGEMGPQPPSVAQTRTGTSLRYH